jgi:HlyD family secretion protein
MNTNQREQTLSELRIQPAKKARKRTGPLIMIAIVLLAIVACIAVYSSTRKSDRESVPSKSIAGSVASPTPAPSKPGDVVLTVSGYVIPRERIEISPRFQGTVRWIGVRKGDAVKKGEVIVRLDDDEFTARLKEAEGRVALAEANLNNAEITLRRQLDLAKNRVDSESAVDEARRARDAAAASLKIAQGSLMLAQTYVNWCTIVAPINGTILEKLADENELVVPQSFGGGRGPSTALVAMADLSDLQVEIDVNESDLARVRPKQRCRITPEAYTDKTYSGYVAEIAPEANRQKGTLQVKVQIENPDRHLTPELTAKVEFLAGAP